MKAWTVSVKFGWCGFRTEGGLFPEVRLGFVRFAACRGWIGDIFKSYRAALGMKVRGVGGFQ